MNSIVIIKHRLVHTDTGLLKLEVQFAEIGKFAECKKDSPQKIAKKTLLLNCKETPPFWHGSQRL